MDIDGKVAIVTGAGRGIGKKIAIDLAYKGCSVVIVSRTKEQLEETKRLAEEINADSKIIAISADLSELKNIDELVDKTIDKYGTIDILINNAAILYQAGIFETDENIWDDTMDINLKALFFLSKKTLAIMKEKKTGYIINISSTAAFEVPSGIMAYGVSKAGVVGVSQALYKEAKEHGVKVSVIYPGMTDTEMIRAAKIPVPPEKWMQPEDISNCVIFLLEQSERVMIRELTPWAFKHDQI